ncbi:hypothetical protein AAEO56_07600 [Flavobacterium sp. DGU11]|uniref:Uncharacterized protein n=1 Tax=Flavobacterium arundinis TaxID=3139143 RepID=A0ABU9HWM3_9FLAO
MKITVILIALLFASCAQRVAISGTAVAEYSNVVVSVNDTLRKLAYDEYNDNRKQIDAVLKNKRYTVKTDPQHQFNIRAKETDSIYFIAPGYVTQAFLMAELVKRKSVNITLGELPCDTVKCREEHHRLYAVVASKIKLKRVRRENCPYVITLDAQPEYDAVYNVLKNVYGDYANDTINFTFYENYGHHDLEKYNTVLLYLADNCGELVSVQGEFSDVYQTTDGRWAAPYRLSDKLAVGSATVKPEKIDFAKPLEYDIKNTSREWIEQMYPAPYYEVRGDKAIAIYGNYAEDLVELRKQTLLKNSNLK